MTYLSQFAANRCEQATQPICSCRCGGALHGAKRVSDGGDYSTLPIDDPHFRPDFDVSKFLRHVRRHILINEYWMVYKAWSDALSIVDEAKEEAR